MSSDAATELGIDTDRANWRIVLAEPEHVLLERTDGVSQAVVVSHLADGWHTMLLGTFDADPLAFRRPVEMHTGLATGAVATAVVQLQMTAEVLQPIERGIDDE